MCARSASRLAALGGGAVFLLVASDGAEAARSLEGKTAERRAIDLEMDVLQKKIGTLGKHVEQRQEHVRRRLRALYKISQGGWARLMVGAEDPAELFERVNGVRRVVLRDLDELGSIRHELEEVGEQRARLADRERRAAALDAPAPTAAAVSPLARRNGLRRPVKGHVVEPFGPQRDKASLLWHTHDGISLQAHPSEKVGAVAAGQVEFVGELPGLGAGVIIAHADGFRSLTAGLDKIRVATGHRVAAGQALGQAAGSSVELQLAESGAWVDPEPWLAR